MQRTYQAGPAANARSRLLIHHFTDGIDAGRAGWLAAAQMAFALPSRRVATFDSDDCMDMRSRRPQMTMQDWVLQPPVQRQIKLEQLEDYGGREFLLLTGPEPDMAWSSYAADLARLAQRAGVTRTITLLGMPATVPHTRQTLVHVTATDPGLVPPQPKQNGIMRMTASFDMYLQSFFGQLGMQALGLVVGVPYYLADDDYQPASVALIERLRELTGLSLPVGDVEMLSARLRQRIDNTVSENSEMSELVADMERHWDANWQQEGVRGGQRLPDNVNGDQLGRLLGDYLARNDARRWARWGALNRLMAPPLDAHGGEGRPGIGFQDDARVLRVPPAPWAQEDSYEGEVADQTVSQRQARRQVEGRGDDQDTDGSARAGGHGASARHSQATDSAGSASSRRPATDSDEDAASQRGGGQQYPPRSRRRHP